MEKKFESSLVLGKFYPPHKGHLYLIDSTIKESTITNVMVCSIKSETIDGELRYEWLKEIYKDNLSVNIIHCDEELPQYPHHAPDTFWEQWYEAVYVRIKELDAVFTSEEYGDEFSKVLGVTHVMVDLPRKIVPVSGTKIRSLPTLYWDYIPDVVKPYFTQKILIMGAESTGKSTLVKRLAEHYNCEYVEEYGRTYTENMTDLYKMSKSDFETIATTHLENILKPKNKVGKYLFIDTDALTTKKFGLEYMGDDFNSEIIENIINETKYDEIFILNDDDVPYINDGLRLPKEKRKEFTEYYRNELSIKRIQYHIINGSFDKKFDNIVEYIDFVYET